MKRTMYRQPAATAAFPAVHILLPLPKPPPHNSTAPSSFPSLIPDCCLSHGVYNIQPALSTSWAVIVVGVKGKDGIIHTKWKEESHNIFHLASLLYLALHRSLCVFWDAVSALLQTVPYLKQINIFLHYEN